MFDPAYPFTLDRDIWCADHPRPSKVAALIHGGTVLVTRDAAQVPLAVAVRAEPWCVRITPVLRDAQAIDVVVSDLPAARQASPGIVAGLGLGLRRFDELEVSLEDVFVDLVGVNR